MTRCLIQIAVSVALVAQAACRSTTSVGQLGVEFSLQQAADSVPLVYQKLTKIGGFWFELGNVQDSRCPRDVVCVQAGDGIASISLHPLCYPQGCAAPSYGIELHTTGEPKSAVADRYAVTLVRLLPLPLSTRPTKPADYVAWVRVTQLIR